jgi:ankyrin repeat protein
MVLLLLFTAMTFAQTPARLAEVVHSGDSAAAMDMLKKGAKGNSAEADGTTALHWAVQQDDARLVNALLKAGAQVRAANRYGVTPLALAAVNGSAPMVDLLLKAGADPNAASGEGETVLMAAARSGQPDAIRLLLKAGANPNTTERQFGETALMWAAGRDNGDAVHALIAGGAKPDAISNVINLPNAKVDFSFAVATALPRGGMTALMYAAREGQLNGVTALADAGANLNVADPEGSTAIVIAIINGHYEVAARLAEKGADPNIGDAAGMAALYAAVDMVHPASLTNRPPQPRTGKLSPEDLVPVLLKYHADPNQPLKAPLLLRQHTGGDAALGLGATPLMRAAKAMDLGLIQALLDGNADPLRAMPNGTTSLSLVMASRGARALTPDAPIYQAVKMMLDHGMNVNATGPGGATLLHQSLDRGEVFVRMLVEHGAKLDIKDATGRTPLDIALGIAPATPTAIPAAAPAGGPGGRGARGGPPTAAPAPVVDAATIAYLRGLNP